MTLDASVATARPRSRRNLSTDFDCTRCGVCCASLTTDAATIADVSGRDLRVMSPAVVRLHVVDGATRATYKAQRAGPFRGWRACVCSCLAGSLLHRVRCTIYPARPTVCRRFKPGSRRCREARASALAVFGDMIEETETTT